MFCFFADFWWVFAVVAAVFVAFLVIVVIFLKRKRTEGELKELFSGTGNECKIKSTFCLCSHQNEEQQCKFFSISNSSISFY